MDEQIILFKIQTRMPVINKRKGILWIANVNYSNPIF